MRQRKIATSNIFTSFDNTQIYYEIAGPSNAKMTLLFLHGLGGNLTVWDPQVNYFVNKGYRTITIDLRGHGLSGRPKKKSKYTMETVAKDIALLLQAHDVSNVAIIGWCLGGIAALLLTGQYGIKPKNLILIATSYKFPSYVSLIERSKVMALCSSALDLLPTSLEKPRHMPVDKYRGSHYFDLRRITSDIYYTSLRSYLATCSNLFTFNGKKLLKNISSDTLIIHGTEDIVFPKKIAKELQKHIKNSQLVLIEGGNHILALNHPQELNKIIGAYLSMRSLDSYYNDPIITNQYL